MARSKKAQLRAEDHGDFAGDNKDKEKLDQLARDAAKANATIGHNSEPNDEIKQRNLNAIMVTLAEIDAAGRIMQKARAAFGAAKKTAKTDMGSQAWADSCVKAAQAIRAADKGGMGGMSSEHRQIGAFLKVAQHPLYHQFGLWDVRVEEEQPAETKPVSEADAYAMGEAAYKNGEPKDNADTVGQPGSLQRVQFERGWDDAFDANKAGIGIQDNDGGESPGDAGIS
jgi:hypothetical protein